MLHYTTTLYMVELALEDILPITKVYLCFRFALLLALFSQLVLEGKPRKTFSDSRLDCVPIDRYTASVKYNLLK